MPAGTSGAGYLTLFDDALAATLDEFTPELVLVSAGYDCLAGDPLGGLLLEPTDVHTLVARLVAAADSVRAPVACTLEGGYAPARTGLGVVATMRALAGIPL